MNTPTPAPRYVAVMKQAATNADGTAARGGYHRVGIVRLAPGFGPHEVTMLSERARAVAAVVTVTPPLSSRGANSAAGLAYARAQELAKRWSQSGYAGELANLMCDTCLA